MMNIYSMKLCAIHKYMRPFCQYKRTSGSQNYYTISRYVYTHFNKIAPFPIPALTRDAIESLIREIWIIYPYAIVNSVICTAHTLPLKCTQIRLPYTNHLSQSWEKKEKKNIYPCAIELYFCARRCLHDLRGEWESVRCSRGSAQRNRKSKQCLAARRMSRYVHARVPVYIGFDYLRALAAFPFVYIISRGPHGLCYIAERRGSKCNGIKSDVCIWFNCIFAWLRSIGYICIPALVTFKSFPVCLVVYGWENNFKIIENYESAYVKSSL